MHFLRSWYQPKRDENTNQLLERTKSFYFLAHIEPARTLDISSYMNGEKDEEMAKILFSEISGANAADALTLADDLKSLLKHLKVISQKDIPKTAYVFFLNCSKKEFLQKLRNQSLLFSKTILAAVSYHEIEQNQNNSQNLLNQVHYIFTNAHPALKYQ